MGEKKEKNQGPDRVVIPYGVDFSSDGDSLKVQRITVSQELTPSLNEGEWLGGQKMMVTRRKAPESQGN